MVGVSPVNKAKEENGETRIPILLNLAQSLCKRGGVTKAPMYRATPAGRTRTVALVFGAVGDLKATHTTLGAGAKARAPGESTLRALLKETVGTHGCLL